MMVCKIMVTLVLAYGLLVILTTSLASPPSDIDEITPNRLIVVLRPMVGHSEHTSAVEALVDQFGAQGLVRLDPLGIDGPVPGASAYVGVLAPDAQVSYLLAELARSPLVLRVEPDVPRHFFAIDPDTGPNDELFQEGLQDYYWDIGVVAMWGRGITGIRTANPITVAVIDTGVDLDHPDIDDNLVPGYDRVEMDELAQDESSDSHGSMVAGVIGAETNNVIGVAGIGGGDAQSGVLGLYIMPVRVAADSSEFYCSQSAQAISDAIALGAQVINMSYGGEDFCQEELDAVQRAYDAGIALVAGAGNKDLSDPPSPFYPAAYGAGTNDNLVIAVTGAYTDGRIGATVNYGEWVDICAPFRKIHSITKDGDYYSGTGTSFSAPFVSGLIGLLMSNYGWSREKAISATLATANNVDAKCGAGLINADRASELKNRVYLPLASRGN
jgi:thermitase